MTANAREWVADGFFRYEKIPQRNPYIPAAAEQVRVIRGGSYYASDPIYSRLPGRSAQKPKSFDEEIGFRCAKPQS
jgi:formylglycine-generating enzyme required for sulfatase activity